MISINRCKALYQKMNTFLYGAISLSVACISSVLILNFFFQLVKTPNIQGVVILIAPAAGLVGFLFGLMGFCKNRNNSSLLGIIWNIIIFIFPFAYWFIVTMILGP